jgi:glycopeptide antibiotics resistance protein
VSRIAVVTALVSLAMEVTQYALALGSTDITDVIANTAGGVAGVALVALVRRAFAGRARAVVTRFCVVSTAVSIVAVGAHIASFPELPAPGQGVVVTGAEAD